VAHSSRFSKGGWFLFQDRIYVFCGQNRSELVIGSGTVMSTRPRPFNSPKGSGTRKCQANSPKLTSFSGNIQLGAIVN
jgi:hypothetical protein